MGVKALNTALYTALTASSEVWGTRIYFDFVPANTAFPYVFMVLQAGGEQNQNKHIDPRYVLAVRIVSDDQLEALTGMERLRTLLNDKGEFDVTSGFLDASADGWQIKTSSASITLVFTELNSNSQQLYHAGHQYIFTMEET